MQCSWQYHRGWAWASWEDCLFWLSLGTPIPRRNNGVVRWTYWPLTWGWWEQVIPRSGGMTSVNFFPLSSRSLSVVWEDKKGVNVPGRFLSVIIMLVTCFVPSQMMSIRCCCRHHQHGTRMTVCWIIFLESVWWWSCRHIWLLSWQRRGGEGKRVFPSL